MCRKKPGPVLQRVRKYTAVFLAVFIVFTTYFELAVKAQLKDVMIREMQTLSEKSVTMAVDDYLAENAGAGERMCDIVYDNGSVAAVSLNAAAVNSAKTFITERAQRNIDELSLTQGASACLGNFTGLVFLSSFGPEVSFPVESSQTVSCEFSSSFEGAGVNQTVHHISITVYVDLLIYSPFRVKETVSTESSYEIAQTVIVGAVPAYSTWR